MPAFNSYEMDPLEGIAGRGLRLVPNWGNAKKGELGVWLSNYDRWLTASILSEPLIVFEDDAIIGPDFDKRINKVVEELPEDWDFVALWVPENQRVDYLYDVQYNEYGHPRVNGFLTPENSKYRIEGATELARVYQGYGMVALMYSPKGGGKLVRQAKHRGIDTPVDCWLYEEAHKGTVAGYAPRPEFADIVTYDWKAVSHVQLTERV